MIFLFLSKSIYNHLSMFEILYDRNNSVNARCVYSSSSNYVKKLSHHLCPLSSISIRDVKPIEHQLRPKGMGLGADRSAIKDLEPGRPKRPPKPGDEKGNEEEALVLGPGGYVLVLAGAHKDLYGKVRIILLMNHCTTFLCLSINILEKSKAIFWPDCFSFNIWIQ